MRPSQFRPELFPLTLQLSVNLIRNTDRGTLTAEAQVVHRGRSTLVVEVRVTDERARVLAVTTGGATRAELESHHPDWLVDSLEEVTAEGVCGSSPHGRPAA